MKTWKLSFKGIVQGVGFRPAMLRCAVFHDFNIQISNTLDGVEIFFNAENEKKANFYSELLQASKPPKSIITELQLTVTDENRPINENTLLKKDTGKAFDLITPDLAWCENCKTEYLDSNNRRHQFVFISCTCCGPRFSIIKKYPFERENTTHTEIMCSQCEAEYQNLDLTYRALSQINTCGDCNFKTHLYQSTEIDTQKQLKNLSKKIKNGELVSMKGVSGFLFIVDYRNNKALQNLRNLKNRPSKPFAMMAIDINWVEENFELNETEKKQLTSSFAPIVILKPKFQFFEKINIKLISGYSKKIGIMLCSTAYFHEICKNNDGAIIATSGNISGFPIEFDNAIALQNLPNYTKNIWYYDRSISFPQDDTVMQISPVYNHPIYLRKSRGRSPSNIDLPVIFTHKNILAFGAEMKSTIALAYENQLMISPYLGKLNTLENLDRYSYFMEQLLELSEMKPEILLIDQHPNFLYRTLLEELKRKYNPLEVIEIQHHEAHFCAVVGENNLFEEEEKITGFVADGMGYATSKEIRGAEFFIYEKNAINRRNIFPSFAYLLNDRMSLEPRLSYYSIMEGDIAENWIEKFSETELKNFPKILDLQVRTNSLGRVFDVFAFLLGFPEKIQSFEGETSLWLESITDLELDFSMQDSYSMVENFTWKSVFKEIEYDIELKINTSKIYQKFLNSLVFFIINHTKLNQSKILTLSGGVFQNANLIDLFTYHCKINKIKLYLHKELSANDENISYGQIMYFLNVKTKNKCV